MKRYRNFIALLIVLAVIFSPIQSAKADIAPPPAPGFGGIKTFQNTEVEMTYERVEVDIQTFPAEGEYTTHEATITAWFVMRNTGAINEKMQVVFPLSDMKYCDESGDTPPSNVQFSTLDESFSAEVNGQMVVTKRTTSFCAEYREIIWGAFDVNFPVEKDVLIKVSYKMQAITSSFNRQMALEYVLATGAGWKGPIKQAYVVFRFPYLVTSGNINSVETTPGFQTLYNEIFWSFRDLEPTPKDNVSAVFFDPGAWNDTQRLESVVKNNPINATAWLDLLTIYNHKLPFDLTIDTLDYKYQQALAANPNDPSLNSLYANFLLSHYSSYDQSGNPVQSAKNKEFIQKQVMPLINKVLEYEPNNILAHTTLGTILTTYPDITLTPPPTIPPTATPAVSSTPTETPSPSITPWPSQTPIIEKVIITKIVTATLEKATPTATATSLPAATATPTAEPASTQNSNSNSNWIMWPTLLIAGFAGGVFVSKKRLI